MQTVENKGIEFIGISKRYSAGGKAAVDNISFHVPQGSLCTILGPSGCGKTTTLRMIAGLELPTSGSIKINGQDVTTRSASERPVSLVFQSYALFPHMNVHDNVAYGLKVSGMNKTDAAAKSLQALALVGLQGFETRWPSELSGGQQQRVALARALVIEPEVLLFDEPLSNLDARLRRTMREEIRALQQRLKLTVAYVTHDQSEALAVSDHIIVMDAGKIAQHGTPRQLYENPKNEFVAGFMGEAMLFQARVADDGKLYLGTLALPIVLPNTAQRTARTRVAIRPQAWQITDSNANNTLKGTVLKASYLGGYYEYTLLTEIGEIFVVCPHTQQPRAAQDVVGLQLSANGVSLLEE